MNYSPIFTLATRTERAYNAAQDFIADDCPVLEQRVKRAALNTVVNVLEFTLIIIDWTQAELEKVPEHQLRLQLAYVKAKRFFVRRAITIARFDDRYQLSKQVSKVWARKGAIAQSALDKVFCLD